MNVWVVSFHLHSHDYKACESGSGILHVYRDPQPAYLLAVQKNLQHIRQNPKWIEQYLKDDLHQDYDLRRQNVDLVNKYFNSVHSFSELNVTKLEEFNDALESIITLRTCEDSITPNHNVYIVTETELE